MISTFEGVFTSLDFGIFSHGRFCRNAGTVIMMAAYGHEVAPEEDLFIEIAEKAMSSLAIAGAYGTFLVDWMPWCTFLYLSCNTF